MNPEKETIEIDLLKLMLACLHRWWQILFVAILGGALALSYTVLFVTPTYQSSTKIYVNNTDLSLGNINITSGDLTASSSLVKVYIEILNTRKTMEIVSERSGLDYSAGQLMSMTGASAVNGTPILEVTVTSTSPDDAHLLASTIADVLPEVITSTIQSSYAVVVDDAIYPSGRSGPSYTRNTMLGGIIGGMLIVAIIVIMEILSVEITNESDVSDITDIPVLGYVTDFHNKENGGKYGKYGKYGRYGRYDKHYYRSSYKRD